MNSRSISRRGVGICLIALPIVLFGSLAAPAFCSETTALNVEVTDEKTGKPINQAQLTLLFPVEEGKYMFRHTKWISYSGKTDMRGRCKFLDVPKGAIRLMVIAPDHQTFGKSYQLQKDNQLIRVKLRKPHPLL